MNILVELDTGVSVPGVVLDEDAILVLRIDEREIAEQIFQAFPEEMHDRIFCLSAMHGVDLSVTRNRPILQPPVRKRWWQFFWRA